MRRILLGLILGLFLISLVQAESIGVFQKDTCVQLPQTCDDCTFVNISSITYPNSTIAISEKTMTKAGTFYSYKFCNTTEIGTYGVNGYGDENGIIQTWAYTFDVTPTGDLLTSGKSILMFLYLIGAVLIFIFMLIGAVKLPFKNKRDEEDGIVGINDLKYVKIILICLCYVTFLFIVGTLRGITDYYITSIGVSNFFDWIYWILMSALWPLIVCSLLLMFIAFINDKKLQKDLERGIQY